MVAKAVGGHQAEGQPPARVGNLQHRCKDLRIGRQLAEPGPVQPVAPSFLAPLLRQRDGEMPGESRQRRGALLPAAAAVLIAVEGTEQQIRIDGGIAVDALEAPQIWQVSPAPGCSAAGGGAAPARIAEKKLLVAADGRFNLGPAGGAAGRSPVIPVEPVPLQLALHLMQRCFGLPQAAVVGPQAEAEALNLAA